MVGGSPAVLWDSMRSMLVEVKLDNSRSESGSAEGSAAVGESPRRGRTHCCRVESSRGRVYCCTRDDFCDGGLRNFGETGHGEAVVPAEVGPERDQPDQPGRAGEMGVHPSGGGTEPGMLWQHRPRGEHQGCARATSPTFWKQEEIELWACPARRRWCRWRPRERWRQRERWRPRERKRRTSEKAPTRSVVARPRLPVAMEAAPKPPKVAPL